MYNSPVMKFLGMASWLITALAALHVGLVALGYDITSMAAFQQANLQALVVPTQYIIGIAGAISLTMFIMALMGTCCCSCGNGGNRSSGYGM